MRPADEAPRAGTESIVDRTGRPPVIDELAVAEATFEASPESLGVMHWSARLLIHQPPARARCPLPSTSMPAFSDQTTALT